LFLIYSNELPSCGKRPGIITFVINSLLPSLGNLDSQIEPFESQAEGKILLYLINKILAHQK